MVNQPNKLPVVYLVDDDAGARDSIGWMLRSRRLLSEGYATAEAFEEVIDSHPVQFGGSSAWPNRPSALVLDLRMPGTNGVVLFDRLKSRGLLDRLPVIFLTGYGDVSTVADAMKRGAFDFIEKPFTAAGLMERIEAALLSSADALKRRDSMQDTEKTLQLLTVREREVLYYVLTGLTSPEIAEKLKMSVRTADTHRLSTYGKFGVGSAMELANWFRVREVNPDALLSELPRAE